jgi:N-acetylmuramoyl-L-alanine amidase
VKNITILSLLTLFIILGSFTNLNRPSYKVDKIVIDAGHGGKDGGTSGAVSKEKDVALKIATELGTIIKEYLPDVEIIYTRNNDTFIELDERANIANKNGADLFVSIHCNAVEYSDKVKGTETWVMGLHKSETNLNVAKRENSVILMEENYTEKYEGFDPNDPASHILFSLYQNAYLSNSLNLAEKIEYQFKKRVGRNSRGVKQAGFVVLYKSSMPSVLVETGFLSNPTEERYLNDELGQTYIASGIFRAIRDYKVEIESMN